MTKADPRVVLGPALTAALDQKGYTELTAVQLAVLDPALEGRDLRISSQTGSGKTLAIGFTLRAHLEGETVARSGIARPRGLVVVPTRELAKQVEAELAWFFAGIGLGVASVIGGAVYRDERRALSAGPAVVVGTPGRLLDHLERGGIDPENVGAVVLDEADRMLDLGFRDELEAILGRVPDGHRTHLVSATFPREVRALADAVQENPVRLEGTRLGEANADIEHVVHLVAPDERIDAIVNLLAAAPDARTLVFARTRADVSLLSGELAEAGFPVASLSGEMEQRERNRALTAFKRGQLRALVATDVAARGIDVRDVTDVVHVEITNDADAYTHRSGRTGRAGRKGRSAILATIGEISQVKRILERLRVPFRFEPIPSAEDIKLKVDDRIVAALTSEVLADEEEESKPDERMVALAKRIVQAGNSERAIARLLVRSGAGQKVDARPITFVPVPTHLPQRGDRPLRGPGGRRRGSESALVPTSYAATEVPSSPPPRMRDPSGPQGESGRGWVMFDVTWGDLHGADARRLLALVCRRGNIRGSDVGAIRVGRTSSVVEVTTAVADAFAQAVRDPDPRDPRVRIRDTRVAGGTESQRPPPPSFRPPPASHQPVAPAERPAPVERVASEEPAPVERAAAKERFADVPREKPAAARSSRGRAAAPASVAASVPAASAPAVSAAHAAPAARPVPAARASTKERPPSSYLPPSEPPPARPTKNKPAPHREAPKRPFPARPAPHRTSDDRPVRTAYRPSDDRPARPQRPSDNRPARPQRPSDNRPVRPQRPSDDRPARAPHRGAAPPPAGKRPAPVWTKPAADDRPKKPAGKKPSPWEKKPSKGKRPR